MTSHLLKDKCTGNNLNFDSRVEMVSILKMKVIVFLLVTLLTIYMTYVKISDSQIQENLKSLLIVFKCFKNSQKVLPTNITDQKTFKDNCLNPKDKDSSFLSE